MAKLRVFELKNIINEKIHGNIESKDILNFLEQSLGVKKTHSSNLEDHEVKAVKEHFIPSATKTSEPPANKLVRAASQNSEIGQELSLPKEAQSNAPKKDNTSQKQNEQIPVIPVQPRQGVPVQPASMARPAVPARPQAASPARNQGQLPKGQIPRGPGIPQGSAVTARPAGQGIPKPQGSSSAKTQQTSTASHVNTESLTASAGTTGAANAASSAVNASTAKANALNTASSTGTSSTAKTNTATAASNSGSSNSAKTNTASNAGMSSAEKTNAASTSNSASAAKTNTATTANNADTSSAAKSNVANTAGSASSTGTASTAKTNTANAASNTSTSSAAKSNVANTASSSSYTGSSGAVKNAASSSGNAGTSGAARANAASTAKPQQEYAQKSQAQRSQAQKGQTFGGPSQGQQGHYAQNSKQSQQTASKNQGPNQSRYQQSGSSKQQTQTFKGQSPHQGMAQGSYKGQKPHKDDQRAQTRTDASGKPQGQPRGQRKEQQKQSKEDNMQKGTYASKGSGSGKANDRKDFDQHILDQKVAEKNDFSNKRNRDRVNKDKMYKDKVFSQFEEDDINLNKIIYKKGQFIKPKPVEEKKEEIKVISLPEIITIKDLADKMKVPGSALIKKLFLQGKIVTINQEITFEEAEEIALEYDIIAEKEVKVNEVEELLKDEEDDPSTLVKRPPVVCVMGHVDHGKTSLLDAIRQTNVTAKEAGGITQHIGAYMVDVNGEKITFLDTPGHEAFTSMRMRGAQATDIAILVVAADDGVMPQTVEAISHAKAAGVQIIVAINKIDKPSANLERVKQELTEYELIAEDWGGDTIMVPVSAHTKEGIDELLEMIILTAEMEELKANPSRMARGIVIEAELDKGRGPVATILVQKGTLRVGDNIAIGASYGKVRAMIDDKGRKVKEATPSTPVEILGLNSVPDVGEIFVVTESEKEARNIAEAYITQSKEKLIADTKSKISLDGLFSQIQAGNIKELNLIIKADVQGSVEALKQSMVKLSNDEVAVRVIHGGVGAINESDVILASTSNAIIIGFNVKPDNIAKERADQEKVEIKLYRVIYNAINDVEAAIKGLLDPVFEEKVIGHAEVRQTFRASGIGTIAGSYVLDGKITRNSKARIYRDNRLVYEGSLASLKRFQDDVKEVAAGFECGLVFEKFNDVKINDQVEFYIITEVPR